MADPAGSDTDGSDATPLQLDEFAACLKPILAEAPTALVIAVSGGPDSIALMHLCAGLQARAALPPMTVATVDHALRPEARGEAEFVLDEAGKLGLAAHLLTWSGPKPVRAIQEKARDARYGLLTGLCAEIGASHLLTAHTLDDQAETILFRIARGSGIAGLAGMGAGVLRNGVIRARPLLDVPKARLVAACTAGGWPFRRDPSNRDPRFARSRLRVLLAQLRQEGLDARRLAQLAKRAARAEAALAGAANRLEAAAARQAAPGTLRYDLRPMLSEPEEFMIRLLGHAAERLGHSRPMRLERLERLAAEIGAAAQAGLRLRRTFNGAVFSLELDAALLVTPEPTRRRGSTSSAQNDAAAATPDQNVAFPTGRSAFRSAFPWQ